MLQNRQNSQKGIVANKVKNPTFVKETENEKPQATLNPVFCRAVAVNAPMTIFPFYRVL
jgi:hypothetical protein